ncbi:hypothetical protein [Roseitranquillus sediminis]|uniref:hypothetical protein n=1 Tax=Roseitranquillus sediminis TaxID=2809051 RepID=UPI001D0C2DF7|nr:hypothetical protein [Roseitranquillus sediminis]
MPAGEIEAAVMRHLRARFRRPEIKTGTWKAARANAKSITEADSALQQFGPLRDEFYPGERA